MPGLVTEEHIAGWKRVTSAVHEAGGRIVAQLRHLARVDTYCRVPHPSVPHAQRLLQRIAGEPCPRLVIQAFRAVAGAVSAEHTGIYISPERNIQGVLETDRADVAAIFTALADGIADLLPAVPSSPTRTWPAAGRKTTR